MVMEVAAMAFDESEKKSKYPQPMSIIALVFWTGLFGGIFWSGLGYLAYAFNFIEISPGIILESWTVGAWKTGWLGIIISLVLIGIFSVGAAFLYYLVLKRFNGFWLGIIYGIVLFFLVFIVLNPLLPSMGSFNELSRDTIITCICLYIVYGLFIGYSISYEHQNHMLVKEEMET
jgi:zinc transporter ZupT